MDFGICLPNYLAGSSVEGIDAAADVAERLGWSTAWTTDHVMVDRANTAEYGRIHEALLTLAWVGARHPSLRLGTSVIVVPQRNAVILAKELATLDALSGGRVIAGIGIGWATIEYANLGAADRFTVRGAYLDETIRIWRHLWSGATTPFEGRFHSFDDFVFEPLPPQGAALPIVVGGSAEAALRRAGTVADGYHGSAASPADYATRAAAVREAATAAGRPAPWFSTRARVRFDDRPGPGYTIRGDAAQMAAEVQAFADAGVTHLALHLEPTDPLGVVTDAERFAREVIPLLEPR
jgi:probable F420-dependent oxidoreductase